MYKYDIREISKEKALEMVRLYHYSSTLPKINKYYLGFYLNGELVGMMTLGYGTRPLHTIKKLFPTLESKDYLEIGRMCMTEEMPRNSESQMIKQTIKWLKKNHKEIKILLTWADGMVGKVGYVYQASNFIYCGYSVGEMYMKDGIKIHPRSMKSLLVKDGEKDNRITVRPTNEQMKELNIRYYKGKQYEYIRFLCGKTEKKRLLKTSLIQKEKPPKEDSLEWKVRNVDNGKWEVCDKPPYITDTNAKEIRNKTVGEQLTLW